MRARYRIVEKQRVGLTVTIIGPARCFLLNH
jgi:hypothetical protein